MVLSGNDVALRLKVILFLYFIVCLIISCMPLADSGVARYIVWPTLESSGVAR